MLKTYLKRVFRILYHVAVAVAFLPAWPLLMIWKKNPSKHFEKIVGTRRWIARVSSSLSGFSFDIRSQTPIDWSKNYIICANHTSNLDIPALIMTCPDNFIFLGKKELLSNPVTRIFFETIDIPLDRSSKIASFRAFRKTSENLQQGKSVVIFPEGKIGDAYPPELYPFKSGPFRLAIEHKTPILPIVIQNAWELCWDDGKKYGIKPGTIIIDVLAPIDTTNLSIEDTEPLLNLTYQTIRKHGNIYR